MSGQALDQHVAPAVEVLLLLLVDQIEQIEVAAALVASNRLAGDSDSQVSLAASGAANLDDVAGLGQEAPP